MPEFEFVHVNKPGDEKKNSTKIRRHVMKDIGKSRRKPKKPTKTVARRDATEAETGPSGESSAQHEQALVPSPMEELHLSENVFPIEMDEERRGLTRFLFAGARGSYRPFSILWLSIGLGDESAWYITLANSVIFRKMKAGQMKPEFHTDMEALKWYNMSLRSISRRLAEPKDSDKQGLATAIAGFICHDSSTGNFSRQEIHLQGLQRIVNDLGGIDEIADPMLRIMISWHDLSGAAFRNTRPYFRVPRGSITDIDTKNDTQYLKTLLASWQQRSSPSSSISDIQNALEATAAVASYINQRCTNTPNFWTNDLVAGRLLAPALHTVLSLEGRALPSDPSDINYSTTAAREAFRRSLLIFLASLKAKFGALTFELSRHLREFCEITQIPGVDWAGTVPELSLWAHAMAAALDQPQPEPEPEPEPELGSGHGDRRAWHVAAIVNIMQTVGFTSSRQVLDVVRRIIWVEALFEDKIEPLCCEIDGLVASRAAVQGLPILSLGTSAEEDDM
ncbi:hypothetical protein F4777DRAFT_160008 [Nemania sp. FL0916]|nr:hypothetical protein F4777DRAFT_160008 [Nemania sp. FL0916]